MKQPVITIRERRHSAIRRGCCGLDRRKHERGVTMALVAGSIVAIMAMAALSIDVVTLYLANTETQRSADAAALAGARVLSLTGMTGDPANASGDWQAACNLATQVATGVAYQNMIGGTAPSTVTVTFPNDPSGNCSDAAASAFSVNPVVQVQIQRNNLPTFFAKAFGMVGGSFRSANVAATAFAEAFNASNSSGTPGGTAFAVGVQPRCVKPLIVGNGPAGTGYVSYGANNGAINNPGVQWNATAPGGVVIGSLVNLIPPPTWCGPTGRRGRYNCLGVEGQQLPENQYIAADVTAASVAVNSGATGDLWQEAIGGCDHTTQYVCGTTGGATADLGVDLGAPNGGDVYSAFQAVTNADSGGADTLNTNTSPSPFQIQAGGGNPLFTSGVVNSNDPITASTSIATFPLMDNTPVARSFRPQVNIVGFLQVFVNNVSTTGGINATVLNVTGCGTDPGNVVNGTSPVPVRLVHYP